jgi:hypothetical protein
LIAERAISAVERHPAVASVRLVGSRAEGRATPLSDWDFRVDTSHFATVAAAMPRLTACLDPLAQQWDRLSDSHCWMLVLPEPAKLDFIFGEPHVQEPPWTPTAENLSAIDAHFWDWLLWLASKRAAGKDALITAELDKLWRHLLLPLRVDAVPTSLPAAVTEYLGARSRYEQALGVRVDRTLEVAVRPVVESQLTS